MSGSIGIEENNTDNVYYLLIIAIGFIRKILLLTDHLQFQISNC